MPVSTDSETQRGADALQTRVIALCEATKRDLCKRLITESALRREEEDIWCLTSTANPGLRLEFVLREQGVAQFDEERALQHFFTPEGMQDMEQLSELVALYIRLCIAAGTNPTLETLRP